MPFLVRWPGRVRPGGVCGRTICFTDLMAMRHHCESVTEEDAVWSIPKHIVDDVLDRRKERVDALRGGLAPA